ncbi:DNA repair protein RecN (Recombination protein N) [Aquimarina sp. EL_43]|uniref:DNA repair protein RecN n=1 Tax=unclassified Aquimarina TaxID=2627091 RepID=UPI0018CBC169|nr:MULTISPECIES: DNA repair protein RecN [unclassified Aquimarina]MBG6132092.1 DNA repair protein RecN (Recombination protein N) [Aquimarina sp. EL_35]MBG6152889.1 DNA repair protein RecN (Recombination protein N) [Aquimarina sp. EL_32]MBG6170896.1 DNA repair protein RecN (Recombination protein N) [Aquimarina sp. EL_43]
MLRGLSIKNFALIEQLQVAFDSGLITITGETGAGKSLLLGALGLLLGKRADLSSVKDNTQKCVIEGVFDVKKYGLTSFFEKEGLDYEDQTIIRREILPSGKSRAFINDTPVTLQSLASLGSRLIDIHSQHQTLEVTTNDFQFEVLDALADADREIKSYKRGLELLKQKEKEVGVLVTDQENFTKEYDYNAFLLNELEEAKLKPGELQELEEQYDQLNNIEEIQERLSGSVAIMSSEEVGVSDQLNTIKNNLSKIESYSGPLQELSQRIQSVYIELDDISSSLLDELEKLEADPERLEQISQRLQLLHNLQVKHAVSDVKELIVIADTLREKVSKTESLSEDIERLKKEIVTIQSQLDEVAGKIHKKRNKALPILIKELEDILKALGMPNATFQASLELQEKYLSNGKEVLTFLFSANKGGSFGQLKKVASGGELSRIMIAIKSILSRYTQLPTIIFDEIDTGVSGEVAHKMADLMMNMSKNLQVFSITHLPQIAANGQNHYKVYKEDIQNTTITQLKLLSEEERIKEIAEMIGGKNISDSALTHAKSLLNSALN